MAFMRVVGLGEGRGQEDRMAEALRSVKNAPPPTYFLIKDHKKNGEDGLFPTRPVCGAKEGPINRLQLSVNLQLLGLKKNMENSVGCKSTEEMARAIQDANLEIE